jgi:hypothetical protein
MGKVDPTLFLGLFGSKPLQFSRVGEMPLLFVYFEICHYNSSSTQFLPFYTSSRRRAPLSDRICTQMFRMVPFPLIDMSPPHVSFVLNLHLSILKRSGVGWGSGRWPLPPTASSAVRHLAPWRPASLRGGGRLLVC